jgi:hypothetical protein
MAVGRHRIAGRWREERRMRAEMMELPRVHRLADYAEMPAGELSGGQRRLLRWAARWRRTEAPDARRARREACRRPTSDILLDTVRRPAQALRAHVVIIEHILSW